MENDLYRRVRIYRIPANAILDAFREHPPNFILVPQFNIPKGAKAISVHQDYGSRSIHVMVQHESFEPVADGCEIQVSSCDTMTVAIVLTDEQKKHFQDVMIHRAEAQASWRDKPTLI